MASSLPPGVILTPHGKDLSPTSWGAAARAPNARWRLPPRTDGHKRERYHDGETDIRGAIRTVVDGEALDAASAGAVMDAIMTGEVTPAQIGALVGPMRMRGETVEEIAGFAGAMRRHALRVQVNLDSSPVVDTCGTGGDASGTFDVFDDGLLRHRRGGGAGGRARQPRRQLEMRLCRPAGGAGGSARAIARRGGALCG